ncbi:uncharacterized protein SPPG_06146 [Spizellomyces punctatus DAOM BR117]|uniref:Uncharacterized protein n=1 Tax=Spizellomyces punctatus (strain DAOM BR117) TaxID=645134 RepID=A0A0L0HBX7_SPIPD|nr:uncharacterized protein SPPG_06146 [Spizellomyces punctatus DAOM BR117]KNC98441.1 hypothetical protein SPPG_06146 [Spizellomyces punctatus DAOM BR117]|eukprot:XP_016606481.1 hypothetical protein SPPG_06146 [Spizellomyces punctatus DAOM BR117]
MLPASADDAVLSRLEFPNTITKQLATFSAMQKSTVIRNTTAGSYEPYDSLVDACVSRVRDAMTSNRNPLVNSASVGRTTKLERNTKKHIPGGRAVLESDDDDDDSDIVEMENVEAGDDVLGWESTDSPAAPEEALVSFRTDLVPFETPAVPLPAFPIAPTRPAPKAHTHASNLDSQFEIELNKSAVLVDLQEKYIHRRLASAHSSGDTAASATQDALTILMEMLQECATQMQQQNEEGSGILT